MTRSQMITYAEHLATEHFRICLAKINGDFGLLDDGGVIMEGFKDLILEYRMMFMLPGLDDYRIEISCDKETGKFESFIFKRIPEL